MSSIKQNKVPVFTERFRKLVEKQSQSETAERLHFARQTIGKWHNGERVPEADGLIAISKAYDVSVDWLLGLTDDPVRRPAAVDELGLPYEAVYTLAFAKEDPAFADNDNLPMIITSDGFWRFIYSCGWALQAIEHAKEYEDTFNSFVGNEENRETLKQLYANLHAIGCAMRTPAAVVVDDIRRCQDAATDFINEITGNYISNWYDRDRTGRDKEGDQNG